jgi:Skp family chaperone for outer membrane proteins
MKAVSLFALLAVGLLGPVAERIAQPRVPPIAYVSLQRISTESTEGKAAVKRLEAAGQARAQDVRAKQKALETTRIALANSGGVFQGSKRTELKAQEERQVQELQKATQAAQAELQEIQRDVQGKMRQELGVILGDIARQRSLQIVLNQDTAVVWAPVGADITAEVLERLNSVAPSPNNPPSPKK